MPYLTVDVRIITPVAIKYAVKLLWVNESLSDVMISGQKAW